MLKNSESAYDKGERPVVKGSFATIERIEGRLGSDTIKLWESYREQAYLWRAISLAFLGPITCLSLLLSMFMFFLADTKIEIPSQPMPGIYEVSTIPDAYFVNAAEVFVNLIATYQWVNAEEQFLMARKYLLDPQLTIFTRRYIEDNDSTLAHIQRSKRSTIFYVNRRLVRVNRSPDGQEVTVRLPGQLFTYLAGAQQPAAEEIAYYITMVAMPRSPVNEYGVMINSIDLKGILMEDIEKSDVRELKSARNS